MNVAEYAACDATELSRLLAVADVSQREVREAALGAIAQVDRQLNAVVHGPFEDARGADGALGGVPFAIKDNLFEAGRPCEHGSRMLEGLIAPQDAELASRFRRAGLVSLVRTALPEFSLSPDTSPLVNGPTLNPWALGRSAGGSSGGSAALVAARALPAAHGNDGAGSIRLPAAWCGLVGLKPSRGRVPIGPMVGELPGELPHDFALVRTVRDAALLLDAVCGPAPGDRYFVSAPPQPFVSALDADPGSLRVAIHTEAYWGRQTEPETRAAVEAVARQLEALGHSVEIASAPVDAAALRTAHLTLWPWLLAITATGLGALVGREPSEDNVETASLACIRHGMALAASDVWTAFAVQNGVSRAWGAFLDDYDLFVCPTTSVGPSEVGYPPQNSAKYATAEAWIDDGFALLPFTPIANTTGQPSVSLPLGVAGDGLPIGVMLTAQTLREDLLFSVAAQLEQAMPWADRTPAVVAG